MEFNGFSEKEEEVHFLSCSSSSSASSKLYSKGFLPQNQQLWLGKEEAAVRSHDHHQLMDLSLGNGYEEADGSGGVLEMEREHMFDKVVTPSDVGKLNRLVIPKQHAERYFPLASSANENGLLLSFEDRNGKSWRFRYSYWNSSQSYVMTKGWSRFVKEKKLDAGDIVSFERGVGELGKDRLYIDWRRRPIDALNPISLTTLKLPNQPPFPRAVRWASRLYSLPSSVSVSVSLPRHHEQLNYNIVHPYHHHHHHQYHPPPPPDLHHHHHHHHQYNLARSSGASYDRIGAVVPQGEDAPVVHRGKTVAKRLRLFGVNMECSMPEEPECPILSSSPTTSSLSPYFPSLSPIPPAQLRLRNAAALPTIPSDFSKKGKSSFDF